jgi:hypothetical protein
MGSIPGRSAGLGSAINNSISRVGQPLLGAVIFIIVSASFYAVLGNEMPGLETSSEAVRQAFPPLNAPTATTPEAVAAANAASMTAFHLAMVSCAGLLIVGSAVSWIGLRERTGSAPAVAEAAA